MTWWRRDCALPRIDPIDPKSWTSDGRYWGLGSGPVGGRTGSFSLVSRSRVGPPPAPAPVVCPSDPTPRPPVCPTVTTDSPTHGPRHGPPPILAPTVAGVSETFN